MAKVHYGGMMKGGDISVAQRHRRLVAVVCSAFASCVIGCGGTASVPVEGTVTLDGQPLDEANIVLERRDGPTEFRYLTGKTDGEGRFTITNPVTGNEGAPVGKYNVRITSVTVPPDADELTPLPEERLPPRYWDGSLSLEVPEGGTTTADFDISTRVARGR